MKIGLNVPQIGHFADPQATRTVAIAAEAEGFTSLWAIDRLLAPIAPRTPYPSTADGELPIEQQRVMDPLVTLTLAAAVTERIRLGTGVLVAPWYPPVLLARTLATLDQVSAGRLTVGLGIGWSVDEYEAVGVPMRNLGVRLEEILETMSILWRDDVAEVETSRETLAPSVVNLKPFQQPRPPVVLASFTPAGLERIARRGDGWLPVGMPLEMVDAMWSGLLTTAARYGRNTDELQLVLRADPKFTDVALGSDRATFTGTRRQVADDIERARDIGVTELVLDLQTATHSADELIDTALELSAGQMASAVSG